MTLGFRADKPEALRVMVDLVDSLGAEPCPEEEVEYLYSYRGGGQRGRLKDYHLLYSGARLIVRTLDAEVLGIALQRDFKVLVGVASPECFCLRGGAALWKGRAVVVLGPEGAGTTTLLTALQRQAAPILADSFLLFDRETGHLLAPERVPVGLIVATRFESRQPFRPRRLTPGEAAVQLFGAAPAAALQPRPLLSVLARVAASVPVYQGERCNAASAARSLLSLLGQNFVG